MVFRFVKDLLPRNFNVSEDSEHNPLYLRGPLPINIMFSPFVQNLMQRPLKTIAKLSGDVYIPRGVSVPALDKDTLWEFQPKIIGNQRAF